MAKRRGEFCTIAQSGGELDCFSTRRAAERDLAAMVKRSAARCRQSYKRCSIIGSARKGHVDIRVGGRQGYHRWDYLSISSR